MHGTNSSCALQSLSQACAKFSQTRTGAPPVLIRLCWDNEDACFLRLLFKIYNKFLYIFRHKRFSCTAPLCGFDNMGASVNKAYYILNYTVVLSHLVVRVCRGSSALVCFLKLEDNRGYLALLQVCSKSPALSAPDSLLELEGTRHQITVHFHIQSRNNQSLDKGLACLFMFIFSHKIYVS